MKSDTRPDAAPPWLAEVAIAQFLLFEATVESLSALGEHLARARPTDPALGKSTLQRSAREITEAFRVRYSYYKRLREARQTH
jgi:hypothetical protein